MWIQNIHKELHFIKKKEKKKKGRGIVSSHFLESKASTCTTVTWKDKHSECPVFLLLSLPQFLLLSMMPYAMEYPSSQLGSALSVMCSLKFLHIPNLLAWGGRAEWEEEETLTLCKYCSAVAKTLCVINT